MTSGADREVDGQTELPSVRKKLSPKRPQVETAVLADAFPYYAGFRFEWALEQLSQRVKSESSLVFDPWNGSGTTTLAARSIGLRSIGVDLNPIANFVARLRAQVGQVVEELESPVRSQETAPDPSDPLMHWLSPRTTRRVRDWTNAIGQASESAGTLGLISLFRVIRSLTKQFEGSNPTWVKRASSDDTLVDVADTDLDALLADDQRHLVKRLQEEDQLSAPMTLLTASAAALPMADGVVDFVLTSPPYLTRIDYAVAYARELAICGVDIATDRRLRSALMGTTLIRPSTRANGSYGPLARNLLHQVSSHPSKASSGYYFKQTRQYLDDLVACIGEVDRVSRPGAVAMLVVQDSYYKDVPVKLADICRQEAELRGWSYVEHESWEVTRMMTTLNRAAQAYTKGQVLETVVILEKDIR